MSTFPNSPKLIKAGIVLVDPDTALVKGIIALQYNSDSLTRTLQVQAAGGAAANRVEPLRFRGPAAETFKLEADIDATDQLEFPKQYPNTGQYGIHPQLALLESLVQPTSAQLAKVDSQASSGTLEISPVLAPLTMFVWGPNRIVPVQVTDFSITEEAFDPNLNPTRARVNLSLRVMTIDDLGYASRGGKYFMAALQRKEFMAGKVKGVSFSNLGIAGLG